MNGTIVKKGTVCFVLLLMSLVPAAPAQDVQPLPPEHHVASEAEARSEATIVGAAPFAPAVSKAQIQATVGDQELRRLHPFFQAVLAERRTGLRGATPDAADAVRRTPGVALRADGELVYSATIHTREPEAVAQAGAHVNSQFEGLVTARLTAAEAEALAADERVRYVEPAELLYPANDMSVPATGAHLLHAGFVRNTPYQGEGALVCIFDTGIDFEHEDFIDEEGDSRIVSIWDQTLDRESDEQHPSGFDYGVEYTREHLNSELSPPSTDFVRQRDPSGHGTHVAGSAAGNGLSHRGIYRGMAPEAELVIVKGGDDSFPTTNTIDGINYCGQVAQREGKPVVVNLSIGGQSGPHDGSHDHERAIDEFVQQPGRAVVAAAGNSGNQAIHISGSIPAQSSETIAFDVPSYEPEPGDDNDSFRFDAWFEDEHDLTTTVRSPENGGEAIAADYESGESGTHEDDSAGSIYIFNHTSEAYNGEVQRVNLQVHDERANRPPAEGRWQLTLTNNGLETARFHGWLYSRDGGPSSTALVGGDSLYTVSSPGTSQGAITVGSYNSRTLWPSTDGGSYSYQPEQERSALSDFSGLGPTRDERSKPDLVAPGRTIVSSRSQHGDQSGAVVALGDRHRASLGTSMATPHATGAAALLLSQLPSLTGTDVKDLLSRSASEDAFTSASMNGISENHHAWGNGKLDALRAMLMAFGGSVAERDRYHYAGPAHFFIPLDEQRMAVRVSPEQDGLMTGFELHMANLNRDSGREGVEGEGNLLYALHADDGGLPGEPLSEVLSLPLPEITPTTRRHFSFVPAELDDLEVRAGEDYHVVFYLEDTSDTFEILADDGTSDAGRSSVSTSGSSWQSTSEGFTEAVEFRLAATVTRTDEAAEAPVALDGFETEVVEGEARLSWRTLRETDIEAIEIEHAPPRASFQSVGEVAGSGSSDEPRDYTFTVSDFEGVGEHRFRLRYIGTSGDWSYSDEFTYLQEVDGRYELSAPYPNPFTNEVHLRLSVAEEQDVQVYVYDLLGRHIATAWDGPLPANFEEIITFNAPSLSSGVYLLRVVGEHFSDTRKATRVR